VDAGDSDISIHNRAYDTDATGIRISADCWLSDICYKNLYQNSSTHHIDVGERKWPQKNI
jgi:hypothetical protein